MMLSPLLMIGLDGATWDIMRPLARRGQLPVISRLVQNGASGVLQTPYLSSPAIWTSIFTGKRQEKHGIEFFGGTSHDVGCRRLWDILAAHGERVGICGELVTWPPYEVPGFMIPDVLALGPETYPRDLQFLQRLVLAEKDSGGGEWSSYLACALKTLRHGGRGGTLLEAALCLLEDRLAKPRFLDIYWKKVILQPRLFADVFVHLCNRDRPRFCSFHFHATDTISHTYWKYYRPQDFKDVEPEDIERYGDIIPAVYREADRVVGQLLTLLDDNGLLVVVSDHGFQSVESSEQKYELRFATLVNLLSLKRGVIPARLGNDYVLRFQDEDSARDAASLLRDIRLESSGQQLFVVRIKGRYLSCLLSDPSLSLQGHRFRMPGGASVGFADLFEDRGFTVSGQHHEDGIVVFWGRDIESGRAIQPMSIFDVAPTVLALLGLPVAEDMDGSVIREVARADFWREYPVQRIDTYDSGWADEQGLGGITSSCEDREVLLQRLRGLGYL
jgi:predicted AlkP superfamily phosphohydrolase/phosphomutase